MLLKNKTAIITGCNRGIGKAILELFAKHGANIFACARTKTDRFDALCTHLNIENKVDIKPIYFDLGVEDDIKKGVKEILSYKIVIDILVNNAGIVGENSLFAMTSIDAMKKVFDINFFAPTIISQYISRAMVRQKFGSIINIASIAGIDGDPAQYEYVASKAALIGASKKLANELGKFNIRVNSVAPGTTKTDMLDFMQDEMRSKNIENTILKREGEPTEIAGMVLYLASDLSTFVTGQTLRVDGGKL